MAYMGNGRMSHRGGRAWVTGCGSPPRLHEGRLFAGTRVHAGVVGGLTGAHERHPYEGMLSGLGFTPIPTFPHQGGRDLQTRNGLCGSLRMTGGRQYC